MEFQFDASQPFQIDAINAAVALFEGQAFSGNALVPAAGATVVPNRLDLPEEQLLENLIAAQTANGLPISSTLEIISGEAELYEGVATVNFPNFSVEMETGTGKTYVYLRTALALAREYGLRKFIVVVPSVAVREGVMKTLRQTDKHLKNLPGSPPFHFALYDSGQPGQVRNFCQSSAVEILVMTIDSFSKAQNVIRKPQEGNPPLIHMLQAVRPVLILDEPQNMESDNRIAALAMLNPAFALRYSATHKSAYNTIYRLSPYDAYRERLVKRIEVAGAVEEESANQPYVKLVGIEAAKKTLTARVIADVQNKDGKIVRKAVVLSNAKGKTDLAKLTGRTDYDGYEVAEISLAGEFVRFTNNVRVAVGGEIGAHKDEIFEAQITYTVQKHFEKQREFRDKGFDVKVLSLFFIDKVSSYADPEGIVRKLFIKAFDAAKADYAEWAEKSAMDVQASYFATVPAKKGAEAKAVDKDAPTNDSERQAQAREFDLIMRRKEQLLSFDEPVAFIFSHSALKEGWDNPNIFQICTLREVGSETERRQQVGRGMRLAVDGKGNRVTDDFVNRLTFVASESYQGFVGALQSEIAADYGKTGTPPPPPNARQKLTVKLRKAHFLKPEFASLWDKIKVRTRYAVEIDSAKLIDDVAAALSGVTVRRPRIVVQVAGVEIAAKEDVFDWMTTSGAAVVIDLEGRYPLPNLIAVVENLMESTSPPMRLARKTVLAMLKRAPDPAQIMANPHEFAVALVQIIKDKLAGQLVGKIVYEPDGAYYEQSQFADTIPSWKEYAVPSEPLKTHIYDHVIVDSATVERPFVERLEKDARVKLYIKLPRWFEVPTPLGAYQPDWAIVMEEPGKGETLYLVRETKGTTNTAALRPIESRKITAARAHFKALAVDYKVVSDASQLPDGGV